MLLVGHSHMECVAAAAREEGAPHESLSFWGLEPRALDDGSERLVDEVAQRMNGPVVSFVGGSAHDVMSILAHPRTFDIVLPDAPSLPLIEAAEILPYATVDMAMRHVNRDFEQMLRLIARSGAGPVLHVEAPPPAWSTKAPDDPIWNAINGMNKNVSPPHLRRKFWLMHCALWRGLCEAEGVTYVAAPPDTMDAAGFLKPEFIGNPAHGNVRYGQRVLAQVQDLLAA